MLVVIHKNGEEFRTFRGFHAPDGDFPLHVLRAAVKNHPELREPLKQQERRRLNLGYTTGIVYAIEWGGPAGKTFCIGHPKCRQSAGWAHGTTYYKV